MPFQNLMLMTSPLTGLLNLLFSQDWQEKERIPGGPGQRFRFNNGSPDQKIRNAPLHLCCQPLHQLLPELSHLRRQIATDFKGPRQGPFALNFGSKTVLVVFCVHSFVFKWDTGATGQLFASKSGLQSATKLRRRPTLIDSITNGAACPLFSDSQSSIMFKTWLIFRFPVHF